MPKDMHWQPIIVATDESSSYFEHGDVYKNSELYTLGNDDSDVEDDIDVMSFEKLRSKMAPITEDGGEYCSVLPRFIPMLVCL